MDTYKITNLKQGVKNPERVNVFVDGKFKFSLDVAQVVDFKLKVGQEISKEKLAELKKASEFGKLYQRTLEWVLIRPRSIRETRDYLVRKLRSCSSSDTLPRARRYGARSLNSLPVGRERSSEEHSELLSRSPLISCGCPSEDILELQNQIITRLVEKKYLDDLKFAEYYVENRFVKKGVSRKRLKMELTKKGVSQEIIEQVLADSGRDEKEEILKIIAKKRAKYDDEKLIQYLCRQGFPYELVRDLVLTPEKD